MKPSTNCGLLMGKLKFLVYLCVKTLVYEEASGVLHGASAIPMVQRSKGSPHIEGGEHTL